jgi:hypothetical protein
VVSEADRVIQPAQEKPAGLGMPDKVKSLLDRWVISTRRHDLQANLDCYAPVVEPYFNKRQLSSQDLVREKQRQFQTIGTVRRLGLENIQFTQLGPDRAVILFDKNWAFGDRNLFSGAERGQLNLRNIGGDWKIAGERELKVYWVRRGRQS